MTSVNNPNNKILDVQNLVAGYIPNLNILHGCSIHVCVGEIVTILGPNGAGKSTLVKAIAGLLNVVEGSIELQGKNITGMETHKLVREGLGYVPQTENVFAKLSVAENLELGAIHHRATMSETREKLYDLFPDLARFRNLAAGKLSGGQRQMVAVGRALMASPSLLMLDEPSAGLSPKLTQVVFQQLLKIRDSGVTILMVEQNARAGLEISDRGYVLAEGVDRVSGDAQSLLVNPEVGELYMGGHGKSSMENVVTGSTPQSVSQSVPSDKGDSA
jgi:branched-chain amino acid transport system ATP-binding protein